MLARHIRLQYAVAVRPSERMYLTIRHLNQGTEKKIAAADFDKGSTRSESEFVGCRPRANLRLGEGLEKPSSQAYARLLSGWQAVIVGVALGVAWFSLQIRAAATSR